MCPAAEGVHINCERLDGGVVKLAAPCGHHAAAAVDETFHDRLFVRSIKPNLIGQVGCTELTIAFAFRSVTDRAIVGEDLCSARQVGSRLGFETRQRANIVGDSRDFGGLQQAIAAEGRHRPLMAIVVSGAGAVPDGLGDVIQLAAPQPVVVVQVRISFGAAAPGAVTRRAIVSKSAPSKRSREIEQFRRRLDLLQRRRSKPRHHRRALFLQCDELGRNGTAGMPVKDTVGVG